MIDETELPFWLTFEQIRRTQDNLLRAERRIDELNDDVIFLRNIVGNIMVQQAMASEEIEIQVIPPVPIHVPDPIPEPSQPPNHERSIKV